MSSTLKLSAATPVIGELPRGLGEHARDLEKLKAKNRRDETVRIAPPPFDELSDEAARAVIARWNRPCEAAFELLAVHFPRDLEKLIALDRLEPSDLTFAAEALGRSNMSWMVRHTLKRVLRHDSAVVREGAIYGLQKHLDSETRAILEVVSKSDASPAVRAAAEDAISEP